MAYNMKALVTGSNGLVGTALKKELGDNHVYHTRKDVDLTNELETKNYIRNLVENEGIDTIIHCAAKVGGVQANTNNNQGFFLENYLINNNILKAAYELKIPNLVNILSTCIFPDKEITYPLTADQIDKGAPHPSNYGYSYAKRLAGYETKIFRNLTNFNWINVVPTNVYGPQDNFHLIDSHMIPGMIHRAYLAKKNNENFVIWGDGTPLRQFIHSEDLAKNIIWALKNWNSETHFMAINEQEVSVMEIAKIITEKFELAEDQLIFDSSKPKGQFRKPAKTDIPSNFDFINLKQGIFETIDWFVENYSNARK
jgi:GDP-L-fucose synthase